MEIKVKDLRVSYGKTEVLKGIDLTVRPGEKIFIGGANGSGKTTLLRALSGILPYAGQVLVDGKEFAADYAMCFGSGGIYSTASELCKYGATFFTGDETLLSDKIKAEMNKSIARDRYEEKKKRRRRR